MELLPEQHAVTNVEVHELLKGRRHARWLSGQHTKKREGHHTSNKEARWLEAKVEEPGIVQLMNHNVAHV